MLLNQGLSSWHILPGSMGSDILSPGKGLALYIQLSFKISGEQKMKYFRDFVDSIRMLGLLDALCFHSRVCP